VSENACSQQQSGWSGHQGIKLFRMKPLSSVTVRLGCLLGTANPANQNEAADHPYAQATA